MCMRQRFSLLLLAGLLLAIGSRPVFAEDIDLSAVPPFLLEGVAPNLVISVDNSTSQRAGYAPDALTPCGDFSCARTSEGRPFETSPDVNRIYYDPLKAYPPGLDSSGNELDDAAFTNADLNPFRRLSCDPDPPDAEYTPNGAVNLSTDYQPIWVDADHPCTGPGSVVTYQNSSSPQPAFYHLFDQENYYNADVTSTVDCNSVASPRDYPECELCGDAFANPDKTTADACYNKILVGSGDDYAVEAQGSVAAAQRNFANWFSFYRTRGLVLKTVLTRVMQTLDSSVRLAYQATPGGDLAPGTAAYDALSNTFASYSQSAKDAFYLWLAELNMNGATFLTTAHIRAGEFVSSNIAQAYNIADHRTGTPFSNNSCGVKCRNNFHLLMTDGVWEETWFHQTSGHSFCPGGGDECVFAQAPNRDGIAWDLPGNPFGVDYLPSSADTRLYADDNIGMLADAAFHYWASDLRPDEDNDVPTLMVEFDSEATGGVTDPVNFWNPKNDPANWQHLALYTVGFGLAGNVTPNADGTDGSYQLAPPKGEISLVSDTGFPGDYDTVGSELIMTEIRPWPDLVPDLVIPVPEIVAKSSLVPAEYKIDDLFHAALNGRGRFFNATDPTELVNRFSEVLRTVSSATDPRVSNAAAVVSSASLGADTMIYQVLLDAGTLAGDVRAYEVSQGLGSEPCADVSRGELCQSIDNPVWGASEQLVIEGRQIITQADGAPVPFGTAAWDLLSATQKRGLLGCDPNDATWIDDDEFCKDIDAKIDPEGENTPLPIPQARLNNAQDRINYLLGDNSRETDAANAFRQRNGQLLGDIIGSNALVVGEPRRRFIDETYVTFKVDHSDRIKAVYVGANDGMLHAFRAGDGDNDDEDGGDELFAYVPEAIYPNLYRLTDPDYSIETKRAFVDGPIVAADAKFTDRWNNGGWKTVLVGSFGQGAQGVYALNITNPASVVATDPTALALWEFTDASGSDDNHGDHDGRDMGYALAPAAVVRIDDNLADSNEPTWVALLGNGYNNTEDGPGETSESDCEAADPPDPCNVTVSTTGNAVLYVLQLGGDNANRILARMDTLVGAADDPEPTLSRANGLSAITAVDLDLDLIADVAYAGDLFGNVWRFDLTNLETPPARVFTARFTDVDGDLVSTQSITTKIAVMRHPTGIGYLLLFGTGRYLSAADKDDIDVQSFYAIWDDRGVAFSDGNGGYVAPARADLLAQSFGAEDTVTNADNTVVTSLGRTSSNHRIDWTTHRGWYIDLKLAGGDDEGERVVVDPELNGNRVVFVSMIPEQCCDSGGLSWINALDAKDGSRLAVTPFDYNDDGSFNASDTLTTVGGDEVPGSSIRILTDGGTGIYSAPSQLGLGGGQLQSIVSDSEGDLMLLRQSTALDWRNWVQLQ